MADEATKKIGDVFLTWRIPEYERHQRNARWYVIAIILVAVLGGLSLFTPNFLFDSPNYLFLIIIILGGVVLILINALSGELDISLTEEGLIIGDRFYDYDEFRDFAVIFKPRENLKQLYLEYKSVLRPRLSIPLKETNPLEVREILLDYLPENLNRTDEANTDFLSRIFKI